MSIFDPYSLYKHRQKQSKKGQVIQKRPVTTYKAYNKKDLEEAYRVLHTYGIPYGSTPPPPPPPVIEHTSAGSVDLSVVENLTWSKNSSTFDPLTITDKDIMDRFWQQSGIGHWIATELDLSKVVSFNYTISSKNITYYYDVDEPYTGQTYRYQIPVRTEDRLSTFDHTVYIESQESGETDFPDGYISKSVINYWRENELRYILNYVRSDGGNIRNSYTTQLLDAVYLGKTSENISIDDLVNGNYTSTILSSTVPTTSFAYDTAGVIAILANVYFRISYTD